MNYENINLNYTRMFPLTTLLKHSIIQKFY